jgi:hypothetical protein
MLYPARVALIAALEAGLLIETSEMNIELG